MKEVDLSMVWSENGQVFYEYSLAWGIWPDLKTHCLGKREDVIKEYPIRGRK